MKYNLLFDPMLLTLQHYATEMPRVSSEHSSSSKGTGYKTFLRSILFPILHCVFGQKCYMLQCGIGLMSVLKVYPCFRHFFFRKSASHFFKKN